METQQLELSFLILVFIIATVYSAVGQGGASGFLALMALFSFAPEHMKATALTLNLFVSGIAYIVNYKMGNFKRKLILPFALASVPMAFVGGHINFDPKIYKITLGIFLFVIGLRFLFIKPKSFEKANAPYWGILATIGALLGFVSGLLGIGGGVILTPIMLLFRWATIREVTVTVAAFVFLNSASGLLGVYTSGYESTAQTWSMVTVAVIGALVGSFASVKFLPVKFIQYLLTAVLLWTGFKLIALSQIT